MKDKKAIFLILVVLAISVFVTGCMNEVEDSVGDDINVDTKDDSASIDNEEASFQIGSDLDWPTEEMKPLPKPKANVTSVTDLDSENTTSVTLSFPDEKTSLNYLEEIKDLGYIQTSVIKSSEANIYTLYKEEDYSMVVFSSQEKGEKVSMTFAKNSDGVKIHFKNDFGEELELDLTGIDMADEAPWPKKEMDKIPELDGKIMSASVNGDYVFIEMQYVKKEDALAFIEKIKSLGYDNDSYETIEMQTLAYTGANNKGGGIAFTWYSNNATIEYVK